MDLSNYIAALLSGTAPNAMVAPNLVMPDVLTQAPPTAITPSLQPAPTINVQLPPPVEDEQTKLRKQYRSQADQAFGADYGRRNIASTLLDDTIKSILEEQKGDASQYLERGRKRGIYNDIGYAAGLAGLGSSYEAGRSKLGELGRSVIDKYRADADAVRDKAFSAATSYTPGTSFSLDPYIAEGNEVISRANQFAGGDLRNTFGGTKLFDFGALNNRAGMAQGAIGGRDSDVLAAIAQRKRNNSFGRGLGSQGAF